MVAVKPRSIFFHAFLAIGLAYILSINNIMDEFIYNWFLAINGIVFLSFGRDKLAARTGMGRTPESTFLLMGLGGAFPAILIGRKIFNHKTTKLAFVVPMWILFFAQIIIAAWWRGDLDFSRFIQQKPAAEQTTSE